MIAGCEAAWASFGGVFRVVIADNCSAIVAEADAVAPRFNDAFVEYAPARGFVIDPARVATPTDKPRVERTVSYVCGSLWAGESFRDWLMRSAPDLARVMAVPRPAAAHRGRQPNGQPDAVGGLV